MKVKADKQLLEDLDQAREIAEETLLPKIRDAVADKGGFIKDLLMHIHKPTFHRRRRESQAEPPVLISFEIKYVAEEEPDHQDVALFEKEFALHVQETHEEFFGEVPVEFTSVTEIVAHKDQDCKFELKL